MNMNTSSRRWFRRSLICAAVAATISPLPGIVHAQEAAALSGAAPHAVPAAGAAASAGTIAGRVTDAGGNRPAARVRVELVGAQRSTLTDADGRYRFDGVAPGAYVLRAKELNSSHSLNV